MKKNDEQRNYARIRSNFSVKINIAGSQDEIYTIKVGKSIDVSARGLLINYDRPLKLGTQVSVTFLRPNSFEFFEGDAKVIRVDKNPDNRSYSVAIEFVNLDDEDIKKLDFYLSRNP